MIRPSHVASFLFCAAVAMGQETPPPAATPTPQTTPPPAEKSTSKTRTSRAADTGTAVSGESMLGPSDRGFLMKAAEGGMMEVQLAQLAQKQGASDEVKQYAQKLEQDHTAANKQLMDIAQRRSVNVPSTLKPEDQQMIDKMTKLSGAEFDREYIKHMVKDHKKDVKEFEKQSSNSMDTDLKTFASSTLPTLKSHLTQAEGLEKSVSSSGTRSRTKDTKDSKDTKETKK